MGSAVGQEWPCAVELESEGSAEPSSLQMHCWMQRDKTEFALPGMVKKAGYHQLPLAPGSTPELVLGRCVGERRSGETQRVKLLLGSSVLKVL